MKDPKTSKPEGPKNLQLDDLELDKETIQELTEGQAEDAVGGLDLVLQPQPGPRLPGKTLRPGTVGCTDDGCLSLRPGACNG